MEKKWIIIADTAALENKRAIELISSAIVKYTSYPPGVFSCSEASMLALTDHNAVIIGSPRENPYIAQLIGAGELKSPDTHTGAYSLCVSWESTLGTAVIAVTSEDTFGVVWGVADLCNYYLGYEVFFGNKLNRNNKQVAKIPFTEKMPDFKRSSSPRADRRAIWTWGHCIYDYRAFFRNMMKLKLNEIVIWCDHPPINGKEVVKCAHSHGIRVIFGYSWGWDVNSATDMDMNDRDAWKKKAQDILELYDSKYADFGADGIYFQSFTETKERTRGDVVIAEAVTDWVNTASALFFEKYPEIRLQFGLHATSVACDLEYLKHTDDRVEILWEDCGAFPYSYYPERIEGFDETMSFTRRIATLRGSLDRFGAVFKGMTTLDWDNFTHHDGGFILGEVEGEALLELACDRQRLWRLIDPLWVQNYSYFDEAVKSITDLKGTDVSVQLLAEDGLIEERIPLSLAIAAEGLWKCDEDKLPLTTRVALGSFVYNG